jgi:hypothetical protein
MGQNVVICHSCVDITEQCCALTYEAILTASITISGALYQSSAIA